MKWHHTAAAALLALGMSAGASASCGSAFCSVNTAWDLQTGLSSPGMAVDLRYEYIKQDQPRTGTRKLSVGEVPRHHDEVYTKNSNWLGSFDYVFNADWAVNVVVPLVDREHFHIHNHRGARLPESWSFDGQGDVRAVGRYRFYSSDARETGTSAGLLLGLKLPTGAYDVRNS